MPRSVIVARGRIRSRCPVGFQNSATGPDLGFLCGSLVLVDEAAEDGPAVYPIRERSRQVGRSGAGGAGGRDEASGALACDDDFPLGRGFGISFLPREEPGGRSRSVTG